MYITVNIYDNSNRTPSPDIVCGFDIAESFVDGVWSYRMPENTEFRYRGELIEPLVSRKTEVDTAIRMKIDEMLNSDSGRKFVSNPRLRLAYDSDKDMPVVTWEAA